MTRYTTPHGVFHIEPKPSLPQVAVVHGFYVPVGERGKGNGHRLEADVMHQLRAELYDFAICTTADDNVPKQACLRNAGWFLMAIFDNRKTGRRHQVWGRQINIDESGAV